MIVDDDPDMADLVATTVQLANDGLEIAGVASSGREAMASLADADVVVLDHRMPDRTGLEVAADMLTVKPHQPIVLFSAYLDSATIDEALRIGVRECVSKSELRDLPRILRKYCAAS